jgi:hypothetical protein
LEPGSGTLPAARLIGESSSAAESRTFTVIVVPRVAPARR